MSAPLVYRCTVAARLNRLLEAGVIIVELCDQNSLKIGDVCDKLDVASGQVGDEWDEPRRSFMLSFNRDRGLIKTENVEN